MAKKAKKQEPKFLKPKIASISATAPSVFVIMLDRYLSVHPNHFPITAKSSSVGDLELVGQHSGAYVLTPRFQWDAVLKENKDLVYSANGQVDQGGIYQLLPASE